MAAHLSSAPLNVKALPAPIINITGVPVSITFSSSSCCFTGKFKLALSPAPSLLPASPCSPSIVESKPKQRIATSDLSAAVVISSSVTNPSLYASINIW